MKSIQHELMESSECFSLVYQSYLYNPLTGIGRSRDKVYTELCGGPDVLDLFKSKRARVRDTLRSIWDSRNALI